MGLKLNGAHQLLEYADDVNLLKDNRHHKKIKVLTNAKVDGLEINRENLVDDEV
jgi:hypothetical protein